jgi:hypothetical protein
MKKGGLEETLLMLLTHAPMCWVLADKPDVGTQPTKSTEELQ